MGEDFIRKTERGYRRSVQRLMISRLFAPPLFKPVEIGRTSYPCMLNVPLKDTGNYGFLLHRRDRQTLEVLGGHQAIGTVQGDAVYDLNAVFDSCPDAGDILPINIQQGKENFTEFTISQGG